MGGASLDTLLMLLAVSSTHRGGSDGGSGGSAFVLQSLTLISGSWSHYV